MPKFGKKIFLTSASMALLANIIIANPSISSANNKPINLKEAIKVLGFERSNKDFKFSKKSIDNKSAIYENVILGNDFKAKTLIVTLSPLDNNVVLDFKDADLSTEDNKIIASSGTIHFDEDIRGTNNENLFQKALSKKEDSSFKGDIKFENLNIIGKDKDLNLNIGAIYVNDGNFGNKKAKFGNIGIEDVSMPVKGMMFKLKKFELANLSDDMFKMMNGENQPSNAGMFKGGMGKGIDLLKNFEVGKLQMSGLEISPIESEAKKNNGNSFGGFAIGNFEINDFDKHHIGRFALEKISASAMLNGEEGVYKFDELSFSNLRLDFIKYILSSYLTKNNSEENKAILNKPIFEYFKGGPLDSGIEKYTFRGLLISGFGGKISLDNLSINTKAREDGMITEFNLPNGEFSIKVVDKEKPFGKILYQGLDKMGLKEIIINYGMRAIFTPETDNLEYEKAFISFKEFGEINFNGISSGHLAWLKKITLGQMNELMRSTSNIYDIDKIDDIKKPPVPKFEAHKFDNFIKFYDGLKFKQASFTVKDLGGLNNIALQEALKQGKSAKEVKAQWAKKLFEASGDRSKSLLIRDISNGLGKYITDGGSFTISTNSPQGLEISDLSKNEKSYKELGIKVQNFK